MVFTLLNKPTMKTFAVRYEVDSWVDPDELYIQSTDIKEATNYCNDWANWMNGVEVHTIREVVGKELFTKFRPKISNMQINKHFNNN